MILKTTPQIIQTYKAIYKNVIEKENELIERVKQMSMADYHIKTTWIQNENEKEKDKLGRNIKERFKRQRSAIEINERRRRKNDEFKHREIL